MAPTPRPFRIALGDTAAGQANIQDFYYRLAPKDIARNAVLHTARSTIEQSIVE